MKIPKQEYTAEFKELAVKRVGAGQSVGAVARELGLVEQTLRNWVKAAAAGKLNGAGAKVVTPEQMEQSFRLQLKLYMNFQATQSKFPSAKLPCCIKLHKISSMKFTLEKVVPWGRSYNEYVNMFTLTETDLTQRILGCGDGPAAFNSAVTQRGGNVISVDPIYVFDTAQIRGRIADTFDVVLDQMSKNKNDYIWDAIRSVEDLGTVRMSAMEEFLADYDTGKQEGRYVAGELPTLRFDDGKFDIALSSHFLFLYSPHLSTDFHIQALNEMLRVSREVRVFPLLSLDGIVSPHLTVVTKHFESNDFEVEIRRVSYEFQRGGNEMLVLKHI